LDQGSRGQEPAKEGTNTTTTSRRPRGEGITLLFSFSRVRKEKRAPNHLDDFQGRGGKKGMNNQQKGVNCHTTTLTLHHHQVGLSYLMFLHRNSLP
jgi:hypothetical protein